MTTDEFIQLYQELFAGTPDCYAIYREFEVDGVKRKVYLPSNYTAKKPEKLGVEEMIGRIVTSIGSERFAGEAVRAHLRGEHFLGVYPIHSDSTVRFFALDFDKDEETARMEAVHQQGVFLREAGIQTYIERSRSGNGYHLWGFLSSPMDAGKLRFALSPYILDVSTYDRMFPNQDGSTESKPYGNLIALPLFGPTVSEGKGVFLTPNADGTLSLPKDQKEFLAQIQRIDTKVLEDLFKDREEFYNPVLGGKIRTGDPEALPGIYKVVHPELGCKWIRWCYDNPHDVTEPEWYALACQFAQLEGGREMFHEFSAQDTARYSVSVTDNKFDHALEQNAPHTCNYIRDNLRGPECDCDRRFAAHGVTHPYDVAKVPFYDMVGQLRLETDPERGDLGVLRAIERVKATHRDPSQFKGFSYGISAIDQYTELRPNDLIIVAARPGRGKTAFMIDVAYRVAKSGKPVYVYSMEMTRDQFWMRLLARIAKVDGKRLDKGTLNITEWKRVIRVKRALEKNPLPIYVDDSTYDATDVVNKCAEQIAEFGEGLVMIDYLQMAVNQDHETDYQKNSRVPRQYKLLGKGMHVPVMVLAQMNREGEDLTEESETLDRVIEGSGKIEQYADVIWFLLGLKRPGIVRRTAVLHKERHREAGHRISLDFHQPTMQFEPEGYWLHQATVANTQVIQTVSAPTTTVNPKDFFGGS